jgi:hypothetical protein
LQAHAHDVKDSVTLELQGGCPHLHQLCSGIS